MIDLRERTHANEASEASGPSPLNSNTNAQQFHGQETDYVAGLSLLGLTPGGLRVGSHPLQVSGLAPIDPGLMREAIALNPAVGGHRAR